MSSTHRERKVTASVACPICRVDAGTPCRNVRPGGVHTERRNAWRAWRNAQPAGDPDFMLQIDVGAMLICPQSASALAALQQLAPDGPYVGGALRAEKGVTRSLVARLLEAGWRIA